MTRATLFTARPTGFFRRGALVDDFLAGITFPGPSLVGHYTPYGQLTPVTGDITVNPGESHIGKVFRGWVSVPNGGATFTDCRFEGRSSSFVTSGLVDLTGASAVTTFNRCTFAPTAASERYYLNGAIGSWGKFVRCDFWGVNDGLYLAGAGTTEVLGCAFHDFRFGVDDTTHANDSRYPNASHNDGIQLRTGTINARGCLFDMRFHPTYGAGAARPEQDGKAPYLNAHGVLINPASGPCSGFVNQCWYSYGENAILATPASSSNPVTGSVVTFTGNRIAPNQCLSYSSKYNQIAVDTTIGSYPDLETTTVYWVDQMTPAALRGQLMPFVTVGNSRISRTN